jgi:hypothetical protein
MKNKSPWFIALFLFTCLMLISGQALAQKLTYEKGWRVDKNGWVYIHIEGKPYERGVLHGYLAAKELKVIMKSLKELTFIETGKPWSFFTDAAQKMWNEKVLADYDQEKAFLEFLEEMKGIADGAREAGVKISFADILAWNGHEELMDYWWPQALDQYRYQKKIKAPTDHCSAFMATGSATKDGLVVMAHNTFDNFQWGQFCNLILDIVPATGHRIFMQSVPGYIDSHTDYFLTGAELMGTETTMGGFSMYNPKEMPEFLRVRRAMQYADNLDDFVELMKKMNSGGYANAWLVADRKTGEIMRYELGLKFYNVERKKDGWFIGYNAPLDPRIRNLECSNTGYSDIRRHQGARRVRLTQLMRKYNGRIDVEIGKKILADHYDVYLKKENNPCSRTVDSHYELDPRYFMSDPSRPEPYQPRGAVDGKVTDSGLAQNWQFWGRWGNSSGLAFDAETFFKEHIEWDHLETYIMSRPSMPWTLFKAGDPEQK